MKFTKMQGCGNDYVYINGFTENVPDHSKAAIALSNRNFGIGSDGLIFINPSENADFEMEMYNSDGSRSEMCGNGMRCVGKYVYDHGMTKSTHFTVDTLAGVKTLDLKVKDGKAYEITVDMGSPILTPKLIPVQAEGLDPDAENAVRVPIKVMDKDYEMTCVSMGNPHAVVFVDEDPVNLDLAAIGPKFENHSDFPNRTNTEFIYVQDRTHLVMRVWERGTGETLACGTGACASLVAAVLNDLTEDDVEIRLLGGTLKVRWDREANKVYLTGPAETVFEGETDFVKGL